MAKRPPFPSRVWDNSLLENSIRGQPSKSCFLMRNLGWLYEPHPVFFLSDTHAHTRRTPSLSQLTGNNIRQPLQDCQHPAECQQKQKECLDKIHMQAHAHTHPCSHMQKTQKQHSRRKLSSFNFTFNVFWFRVWGTSTAWCPVEAVQHFKLSLAANLLPFTLLKWWHPQLNVSLFEDMWLWWIKTIKFQS